MPWMGEGEGGGDFGNYFTPSGRKGGMMKGRGLFQNQLMVQEDLG